MGDGVLAKAAPLCDSLRSGAVLFSVTGVGPEFRHRSFGSYVYTEIRSWQWQPCQWRSSSRFWTQRHGLSSLQLFYGVSTSLLEKYAWYFANSKDHAWNSGALLPNDLGLFDMLGNVFEWCQDRSRADRPIEKGVMVDLPPTAEVVVDKQLRILRGGSYGEGLDSLRCAYRAAEPPTSQNVYGGFRIARTYP